jgi:serine/threonine protein kinase
MSKTIMGRYELVDRLGAGGMAEVWLADQTGPRGFRRRCVIKRIHSHLNEQQDFVERFEDEARLAAMLRHPNIVRVEDFGEVDGNLFMALEYVDGWEFADLLRRGATSDNKISDRLALGVIIEIAEALDHAHNMRDHAGQPLRIVHRDVSPQNILIERSTGTAKLLDFGIASAESNLHETQAGLIKGKIAYFSPEQARGDALDGRTDLYALGLVLHEALIGKRVFSADSMVQLLRDVSDARVPSIIDKRPDLPRSLMAAVDRATSPGRNDRFPSGAAMAAALSEGLEELGGALRRGTMDRWVGSLPAASSVPTSATTSGLPMAPSKAEVGFGDQLATDHPTHQPKAMKTIATLPGQDDILPASAEQPAGASGDDEATFMGRLEERTQSERPSPLRPGPQELATQHIMTAKRKFPLALVVSGVVVFLALLVSVLLLLGPAERELKTVRAEPLQAVELTPAPAQPEKNTAPLAPEPAKSDEPRKTAEAEKPDGSLAERAVGLNEFEKTGPKKEQRRRKVVKKEAKKYSAEKTTAPIIVRGKTKQPSANPALTKRDLDAVTMKNFQALANCRQGAKGLTVNMKIHKNGMVFGLLVVGAEPEVATCLRKLVRKWRYPAHRGPTLRHSIKF